MGEERLWPDALKESAAVVVGADVDRHEWSAQPGNGHVRRVPHLGPIRFGLRALPGLREETASVVAVDDVQPKAIQPEVCVYYGHVFVIMDRNRLTSNDEVIRWCFSIFLLRLRLICKILQFGSCSGEC